jgi:hypothetical protein
MEAGDSEDRSLLAFTPVDDFRSGFVGLKSAPRAAFLLCSECAIVEHGRPTSESDMRRFPPAAGGSVHVMTSAGSQQ